MSCFSEELIGRSGYERDGFAETYDLYRPVPPVALLEIVTLMAGGDPVACVVDLGCGTGLSTRVWSERSSTVVGVEPNNAMIERARLATSAPSVRYVHAFAAETGLPPESADIVTCAQAFHWMDPPPVLSEAARVLRIGGVFAAYDYDVPPVVHPEVDDAFGVHFEARRVARSRLGLEAGAATWPKERHLDRIRESGRFRFCREFVCHGTASIDADRMIGLAESIGGPREIFDGRAPEVDETFERLRDVVARVLADETRQMSVGYRARVGVR